MVNRFNCTPTFLVTLLLLGFSIVIGDALAAPQSRDCSAATGPNAKIDCAAENMVAEFAELAIVVDELESATRVDFAVGANDMASEVERMSRARERSGGAGAFKNLARQQDLYKTSGKKASEPSCFVLEADWMSGGDTRDQNIICGDSPGEKCSELCPTDCDDPDLSLDCPCDRKWDGVCKGKDICEECCEGDDQCALEWEEYIADPESGTDPIDGQAAEDIANSFQNAADAVRVLKDSAVELATVMDSYHALESVAAAHDPRCEEGTLLAASVVAKSTTFIQKCLAAFAVTTLAHDACDSAANNDVLGFNGSAVCVVTAMAKGIAYTLWETSEFLYDVVTSEQVENLARCSAALSEGLAGISDGIAEVDRKLIELQALMIKRFEEVVTLLNTPQGQRPNFPVK